MDFKDDPFGRNCQYLERIAELKEKGLLEEAEYQDLRRLLLSEMKRSTTSVEENIRDQLTAHEVTQGTFLPYGQLHSQIVQRTIATYKSAGANVKQRVFSDMSEMAEKQALYPGDSIALTELIEVVFVSFDGQLDDSSGEGSRQLLVTLRALNDISAKIKDAKDRSPAAKAIADTAQQSATRAVEEFGVKRTKPEAKNTPLANFWSKFVLKDIEGAFEGGAAAVTVFPAFAATFPLTLPIVAAFGVVVGAGVKSGIAYAERGAPN